MTITLQREATAEMIRRMLSGTDHRDLVVDMIDAAFVSTVVQFFEKVVRAKMRKRPITLDWYRENFLSWHQDKADIAMNAGLNMKTISNKRQTTRKEIVVEEALNHHGKFVELVELLINDNVNVDLSLTLRDVTVHLDLNESMIVINALAVRRAAISGGAWSTAGKQVESPLMEVLCRLFGVEEQYFTRSFASDGSLREVDFYLLPPEGNRVRCEVKTMGRGNPESADTVFARESKVFVASTLSDTNKTQLDEWGVFWTELQVRNGFLRFQNTLANLDIPHSGLPESQDYTPYIERAIQDTFRF